MTHKYWISFALVLAFCFAGGILVKRHFHHRNELPQALLQFNLDTRTAAAVVRAMTMVEEGLTSDEATAHALYDSAREIDSDIVRNLVPNHRLFVIRIRHTNRRRSIVDLFTPTNPGYPVFTVFVDERTNEVTPVKQTAEDRKCWQYLSEQGIKIRDNADAIAVLRFAYASFGARHYEDEPKECRKGTTGTTWHLGLHTSLAGDGTVLESYYEIQVSQEGSIIDGRWVQSRKQGDR